MSSGEAEELFDFLVKKLGYSSLAFSHDYEKILVRRGINYQSFWVDFSDIYNNKNELKKLQDALRKDGLRKTHHIFSEDLDISEPTTN